MYMSLMAFTSWFLRALLNALNMRNPRVDSSCSHFYVSDLSVGGSRCYDRMHAWVERNNEGYSGAEEVFRIRRR